MLQLRFIVDGKEKTVPLSASELRFGRSGGNEVVLPDYSVSRRHAAVRREDDGWYIRDLQSTNGVQLNGSQVERAQLCAGDLLKIGVFEIRIEDPEASGPRPAAADPSAPQADPPSAAAFAGPRQTGPLGAEHRAPADPRMPQPPTVPQEHGLPPVAMPAAGVPAAGVPAAGVAGVSLPGASLDAALSNATIIRPLKDISADYGLAGERSLYDSGVIRQSKREALDQAYSSHVFGVLTKLARTLITTDSDDRILEHAMAIAFEVLPVDRGFILLHNEETGELACELVRINQRTEFRPTSEVPISKTMLEAVMRERVALMTYDALSDQRLAGTESVRIHQIRAAMCTPLWSGEKIIGVMQLDTPHHTGSFTEPDVDLVATVANYCAVAIERNRHAREVEHQRAVRARLERYHSPAVIEEVMKSTEEGIRSLKRAEVSVLFADIVGFTAFSENSDPEEVADLMDGFFTHAVEAIFSYGGTLDKFIGDCVMAFFGAPMPQPDHALRAVQAAIRICEALDGWNSRRRQRGLDEVAIRVAVNSGPVVVGDIGSNRRVDYTVLGNTVNVAARLEGSAAAPGDIVLGDATWRQLAGAVATEPLGRFQFKGLSQRVAVHRVVRT